MRQIGVTFVKLKQTEYSAVVCVERCQPGRWSSSGLEPCQVCTPGSYQDESGATACVACPPHRPHTLPYIAAVTATDCFGQ